MRRIFHTLPLFITFIIFLSIPLPTLAQENTPSPNIEVNHVARGFEKVAEKLTLLSKLSKKSKANYHTYLLEKRLAELHYAVNNNVDLVEETASRYSSYAGRLSGHLIKNKLTDNKEEILNMYERHSQVIENLQQNFEYDSGWWLAIQHDRNVLKEFAAKLQNI